MASLGNERSGVITSLLLCGVVDRGGCTSAESSRAEEDTDGDGRGSSVCEKKRKKEEERFV